MATLQFLGAAGTVTGSKFLLSVGGKKILVDCGLFQGVKDLRLRNWAAPPVDPSGIDAILLTHAHLDHCGYIPLLVKHGFKGPIHCSAPTRAIAKVILLDSAKIQEEDAERANAQGYSKHHPARPLYTTDEAEDSLRFFRPVNRNEWVPLSESVRFRLRNSGHILGSAFIEIAGPGVSIAFSGDLGRTEPLLLHPPDQLSAMDHLVVESTYGDKLHPPISPLKELGRVVRETAERGGHVLIPAFAVGRTQDLLYLLDQLRESSQIPHLPIFLDSPMGINATEIFTNYPDWHRLSREEVHQISQSVTMVQHGKQSMEVARRKDPSIVIAGSGMISGGRILGHLQQRLPDDRNTVILVGFQAPGTRGALLRDGITELKMYGEYVPVRAKIEAISSLSAHGDQRDILRWIEGAEARPQSVFIVHGEPQASDALRVRIQDTLGIASHVPKQDETFSLADAKT